MCIDVERTSQFYCRAINNSPESTFSVQSRMFGAVLLLRDTLFDNLVCTLLRAYSLPTSIRLTSEDKILTCGSPK